jgi:hypothetical protein
MTNYAYTYPRDLSYLDDLPESARELGRRISTSADSFGRDLRDLLVEADASPEDKAALAEVWGGPGAGAEFLR